MLTNTSGIITAPQKATGRDAILYALIHIPASYEPSWLATTINQIMPIEFAIVAESVGGSITFKEVNRFTTEKLKLQTFLCKI